MIKQGRRILFLLIPTSCLCISLAAQEKLVTREDFLEAESYFLYEEYEDALPIYIKLKDVYSNNYNLDYRIGRCYLNIPFEYGKSQLYLENAVRHISILHKENSLREMKAPPDALFYLAEAYRVNNELDKAISTFNEFKEKSNSRDYDFDLVQHEIEACQRALVMIKHPVDMTKTNLGEPVNTKYSETNPVVSEDEHMLVYATRLPFYEAVFYSIKTGDKWSKPMNMMQELGVDGDCFPTGISADGKELFLYRSNEYQGDLYVSNFQNGRWTRIRKLNNNINTKYWESHASVSHDGKTLYFTSNRKGGFGGLDIYKSKRTSTLNEDWGIPENLGPVINSVYNEETPFITAGDRRLYFSSYGHETMGGYDIFYSDLNDDGSWSKPVNIGYPVNTTYDELFFNPLKNGEYAYMARSDSDGMGKFDIYRFEIFSDRHPGKYLGNIDVPQTLDAYSNKKTGEHDYLVKIFVRLLSITGINGLLTTLLISIHFFLKRKQKES